MPLAGLAAKHAEVKETWQKLAPQWERLARGLDATAQQAQQTEPKDLQNYAEFEPTYLHMDRR